MKKHIWKAAGAVAVLVGLALLGTDLLDRLDTITENGDSTLLEGGLLLVVMMLILCTLAWVAYKQWAGELTEARVKEIALAAAREVLDEQSQIGGSATGSNPAGLSAADPEPQP